MFGYPIPLQAAMQPPRSCLILMTVADERFVSKLFHFISLKFDSGASVLLNGLDKAARYPTLTTAFEVDAAPVSRDFLYIENNARWHDHKDCCCQTGPGSHA